MPPEEQPARTKAPKAAEKDKKLDVDALKKSLKRNAKSAGGGAGAANAEDYVLPSKKAKKDKKKKKAKEA